MVSQLPPSGWVAYLYQLSPGPLRPQVERALADYRRTHDRGPDGVAVHPSLTHALEGLDLALFSSPGCLRNECWLLTGPGIALFVPKLSPHPGGRPRREIPIALALSMKAEGLGVRELSRRLRLPKSTLSRRLNGRG